MAGRGGGSRRQLADQPRAAGSGSLRESARRLLCPPCRQGGRSCGEAGFFTAADESARTCSAGDEVAAEALLAYAGHRRRGADCVGDERQPAPFNVTSGAAWWYGEERRRVENPMMNSGAPEQASARVLITLA